MSDKLAAILQDNPIIASVIDEPALEAVFASDCAVVFLRHGSVLTIGAIIARLKTAGKLVFVDVDLIDGFASKEVVISYISTLTDADGILSSKAYMVKAAKAIGLVAIHRFFLLDSMAYRNLPKQVRLSGADAVQIQPGCMPRVISWIRADVTLPIIAGGLVCDKEDIVAAIGAGASAIASSNRDVWAM